jgi:hypothetical protein
MLVATIGSCSAGRRSLLCGAFWDEVPITFVSVLWGSEPTFHKQWKESLSSRTKTKSHTQTEENQHLFYYSEFLKSRSPLQVSVRLLL